MDLKNDYDNKIDIILLNVDNQSWLDLIKKYHVNGIPQLNLFNELGEMKAELIGLKTTDQINEIASLLLNNKEIDSSSLNLNDFFDTIKTADVFRIFAIGFKLLASAVEPV